MGGEIVFFGANQEFDLNGTGSIDLSDNSSNTIIGLDGLNDLVVGSGQIISGSWTLHNLSLRNMGTITAGPLHPLVITPTLNVTPSALFAAGAYGGSLSIQGDLSNWGIVEPAPSKLPASPAPFMRRAWSSTIPAALPPSSMCTRRATC